MSSRLKSAVFLFFFGGLNMAFGQEVPWETGLDNIISLMTGNTATAFATIAVIVLGYLAMVGRLDWARAGAIIFGIVVVFGAPHIVSWFS